MAELYNTTFFYIILKTHLWGISNGTPVSVLPKVKISDQTSSKCMNAVTAESFPP